MQLPGPTICNKLFLTVNGMPFLKDDYEVPDPKDIVKDAMSHTGNLQNAITARLFDISTGQWLGALGDVLTSLSIPVFMVQNAVQGMADAKKLGEDVEKEEAKNQLLLILSLVFFIVPFLGEAAAVAAGLAQLARVIAIAGIAGNAALSIRDIVENPEMAPLAILDLLTAGRLKTPKDFLDASAFRRAMKGDDIKSLGETFAKQDEMVQKIVKACKK